MSITQTHFDKDLAEILGLDGLSTQEQAVFLGDIGDLILESALLRLASDLTPAEQSALDHYLETEPSGEDLLQYLLVHHKTFSHILESEITAFKEEALRVLSRANSRTSGHSTTSVR